MKRNQRLASSKLMALDKAQARLALLWLAGSGMVVTLVAIQTVMNHFEGKAQEAWEWLLSTLIPTLSMIVASLGYTALDQGRAQSVVRRSFYSLALYTSAFYILSILFTILVAPFTASSPIVVMHMSNLCLGPIHALVTSTVASYLSPPGKTTLAPRKREHEKPRESAWPPSSNRGGYPHFRASKIGLGDEEFAFTAAFTAA